MTRYEHIEWNLSTAACAALLEDLEVGLECAAGFRVPVVPELQNCANELRARLQRRDVDPHCPLNASEDWLDG